MATKGNITLLLGLLFLLSLVITDIKREMKGYILIPFQELFHPPKFTFSFTSI